MCPGFGGCGTIEKASPKCLEGGFSEVSQESFKYQPSGGCAWQRCLLAWGRQLIKAELTSPALSIKEVAFMSWRIQLLAMVAVEKQSRSKEGK